MVLLSETAGKGLLDGISGLTAPKNCCPGAALPAQACGSATEKTPEDELTTGKVRDRESVLGSESAGTVISRDRGIESQGLDILQQRHEQNQNS